MQVIEFYVTERVGEKGDRVRDWALPAAGGVVAYRGRLYRVRDVLYRPQTASGDRLPELPTVFVALSQDSYDTTN